MLFLTTLVSLTKFFIESWYNYAKKNLNTHEFSTVEYDDKKYLLFFTDNKNNVIAKDITNNTIDKSYYIFEMSDIKWNKIVEENLPLLEKKD